MAYDRGQKAKVDRMSAGELIHLMLTEFEPNLKAPKGEDEFPALQSTAYFWAAERLNQMLPYRDPYDRR